MTDPTRESAYALINAVTSHGQSLDTALNALSQLDPRDKSAAHRLAAATLRHTGTLTTVLEAFLQRDPPEAVRKILWLGAAAILFLDSPAHAAVGTAVNLAKTKNLLPFAGLINAVLRKVAASGVALLEELDMPRLDTPSWAWTSWGANARAIATAHQHEAPLDITVKPGFIPQDGVLLPTGSYRFPAGTSVTEITGYHEGQFWVQDAAATLAVQILAPQPGERILDICAAPGGKTAQLAATGANVTALDRDESRLATLKANLTRLNLSAEIIHADATSWQSSQKFDAILLDAPCSATGTIRRHPDLLHLRKPKDINALTQIQDHLLSAAASMLAPGGRLIYAVCSLQPEEGEPRVAAAASRLHLRRDRLGFAAAPEFVTAERGIRTHPGLWPEIGGLDGFFIARLGKP